MDLAGFVAPPAKVGLLLITGFDPDRDAEAVHALIAPTYREAGKTFPSFERWREALLADPDYSPDCIFLARLQSGEPVGVALCWNIGFVKDLAVAPAHRKQGIGRALMEHVFAHFARAGCDTLDLKVDRFNKWGAERLYRSLGMVDVEARSPDAS